MSFLYLFAGLIAGAMLTWIATARLYAHRQALQIKLEITQQQLAETTVALDQAHQQSLQLTTSLTRLETINSSLTEKLAEQKQEVAQIEEKLAIQFRNLANDLLEEKSQKFTDQNRTHLERLLKPLGERIQTFEKQVAETNKEGLARNVALRTEISKLHELNAQITREAANLTKAIKGDTKIQGNWGEFILESILEKSGLARDREYTLQPSFVTEEGRRLQPDAIIKLPTKRNLIIDAKVSLVNYEQFFNTDHEAEKQLQLKQHLQSIRKHIKTLSEKNYQTQYDLLGLDFVFMFIPLESAFSLAVQHDPALLNEAYEKNIVIVSPTTLIATLRTIANIWKHEYQNQNALEIAHQSGALYDKFVSFVEDLKQIGKQIDTTHKVYTAAMKKLCDGRGNLVRSTHQIKALGARTSKTMDQQLLDRAYTQPPEEPKQLPKDL
ncbi:MAG: DNA recombination protein RmuC [Bacteroidota bacterium]